MKAKLLAEKEAERQAKIDAIMAAAKKSEKEKLNGV